MRDAEIIAKAFHEAYERLAPRFEYTTRKASAKPWEEVPAQNRDLMVAVVQELLDQGTIRDRAMAEVVAPPIHEVREGYGDGADLQEFLDGCDERLRNLRNA